VHGKKVVYARIETHSDDCDDVVLLGKWVQLELFLSRSSIRPEVAIMSARIDGCAKRGKKDFPLGPCRVDHNVVVSCHRCETMSVADVDKDRVGLVPDLRCAAPEHILIPTRQAYLGDYPRTYQTPSYALAETTRSSQEKNPQENHLRVKSGSRYIILIGVRRVRGREMRSI
jgi:hypothetical protein